MKTITLKTQDDFFEQINQMALDANLSKSAFIRQAIKTYQNNLERENIIQQMQKSSFETRGLDAELIRDFEALDDEYLLPPWKD
jgi:predicted transcriptional regulator